MQLEYRKQFIILLVWIFAVMALFRLISDKQIAATIAGVGFLLWPTLFLATELKRSVANRVHVGLLLVFLICSALPVFFLRVLNWGVDFSTLSFVGVPAPTIHKVSNYTYMMMVASALYFWLQGRKKKSKS